MPDVTRIVHAENEVKALQKLLGAPETGVFDAATNAALFKKTVEWQANFNAGKDPKDRIKVDGWMGPDTLAALEKSNPEAYGALNALNKKVSDQREPGPDGQKVFGLKTLQSRIHGENGHPPKGQELNAEQIKAVTGKDFSSTAQAAIATTSAVADGGEPSSVLEIAAAGGGVVAAGFTAAAAWKRAGAAPASTSPGTGLAARSPVVVERTPTPTGVDPVRLEKDITPQASAETSGPNRPGRVSGAPGAASAEAGVAETSAARGVAGAMEAEVRALAKTADGGAASAAKMVDATAKEASWLTKIWRPVASVLKPVATAIKPLAVVADPVIAASTAESGSRLAAAGRSMARPDYVLGGVAAFGGAVAAPVAATALGLKAAWEQGAEDYAAEQTKLAGELAPHEKKEVDLLHGSGDRYGDLMAQIAISAGRPIMTIEDAARCLQDKDVFEKVWNHYQNMAENAVNNGTPAAAKEASLNMALLQDFMKTEAVRKAAEEKFKDDRDPIRAMGRNTDPTFVPVF